MKFTDLPAAVRQQVFETANLHPNLSVADALFFVRLKGGAQ